MADYQVTPKGVRWREFERGIVAVGTESGVQERLAGRFEVIGRDGFVFNTRSTGGAL